MKTKKKKRNNSNTNNRPANANYRLFSESVRETMATIQNTTKHIQISIPFSTIERCLCNMQIQIGPRLLKYRKYLTDPNHAQTDIQSISNPFKQMLKTIVKSEMFIMVCFR